MSNTTQKTVRNIFHYVDPLDRSEGQTLNLFPAWKTDAVDKNGTV